MNRRDLETLLLTLESTPVLLNRAANELSPSEFTGRGKDGAFSLVEHVWHLADLEREGYGTRICRLLSEEEPVLSNFDGERAAQERVYQRRDLRQGLQAFAEARRQNVETLRRLSGSDWKRGGVQDSVGRVTLADLPRMMAEHDRSHTQDIKDLLCHIRTGAPLPASRPSSEVA